MAGGRSYRMTLFCSGKNAFREKWDGARLFSPLIRFEPLSIDLIVVPWLIIIEELASTMQFLFFELMRPVSVVIVR